MDTSMHPSPTFSISVGTDYDTVIHRTGLTKAQLRQRVDAWFKDERSSSLYIQIEPARELTDA